MTPAALVLVGALSVYSVVFLDAEAIMKRADKRVVPPAGSDPTATLEGGRAMKLSKSDITPEVEARFWSKVDQSGGPDACWGLEP